ncbi:MAG: hypothetical protein IPL96_17645 [Holophagaceae bacterium]|nr:hypothetical protein [Holophagaceae bacterium]
MEHGLDCRGTRKLGAALGVGKFESCPPQFLLIKCPCNYIFESELNWANRAHLRWFYVFSLCAVIKDKKEQPDSSGCSFWERQVAISSSLASLAV